MIIDLRESSDFVDADKNRKSVQPLSLLGSVRFQLSHHHLGRELAETITIDNPAYLTERLHGQYINLKAALFHEIETLKALSTSTTTFVTLTGGESEAVSDNLPSVHLSVEHENIDELYDRIQQHEDKSWYCDGLCGGQWEEEAMQDLEAMQGMSGKLGIDRVAIKFAEQIAMPIRKAREQRSGLPGASGRP